MTRLAAICETLKLDAEAQRSRLWLAPIRRDQRMLYLPTPLAQPSATNSDQASWTKHFNAARLRYADSLFAQAEELAATGEEQQAFLLLWQVLRENPDHVEAKRILGPLATAADVRPKVRKATTPHPDFGWPAGSYYRIETPHFRLTSRTEPRESIELAGKMESFFAIWQQLFFPLWCPPGQLTSRFAGRNIAWQKQQDIDVYLLRDRAEYLQALGAAESNIGVSVGYYAPQVAKSFFYPDQSLNATLFHELTHQLLSEATNINAQPNVGEQGGVWLLEGIALYMESLTARDDYWTVGGIESARLQTARYRAIRDGYWLPWSKFTAGSIASWKSDPDIARLYTQSAGLCHVFMDHLEQPAAQQTLLRALVSIYQNSPAMDDLLSLLGGNDENANLQYQQTLTVDDAQLQALVAAGHQVEELVLAGSQLSASSWKSLEAQRKLKWLDLSFANARTDDLGWLSQATTLERLSVEGSLVDGAILNYCKQWERLRELDLSGCSIDDRSLRPLRGQPSIETLWLTQTAVSDASLPILESLPKLKFCDIEGTQITAESWQQFLDTHPQVNQN